jgi:hypothetical protein
MHVNIPTRRGARDVDRRQDGAAALAINVIWNHES